MCVSAGVPSLLACASRLNGCRSFRDVQLTYSIAPPPSAQKPASCPLLPTFQQFSLTQFSNRATSPGFDQTR